MPEYIEREAFIEDIKTEIVNLKLNGLKGTPRPCEELYGFIDRINEQPAADVVEVVRCKDCKNYNGHRFCLYHADPVDDNDFCSYGERKEDEGK